MIIDTHIHLDDTAFDIDREELISNIFSPSSNISKIVNIGANIKSSTASLELANKYQNIYATIGVHPCEIYELNELSFKNLETLAINNKVVAIGEIGLDYYWDTVNKETQIYWFKKQIELAHKLNLPLVIHSRDAAKDTFDILKEMNANSLGGVIHCYSYSLEMAKNFEKLGFYFGIGGVISFKNSKKLKEVVEYLDLSKIVLETDAPYLAPSPHRGKRNSSLYLSLIIDEIANIKNIPRDLVIEQTNINAHKLYNNFSKLS